MKVTKKKIYGLEIPGPDTILSKEGEQAWLGRMALVRIRTGKNDRNQDRYIEIPGRVISFVARYVTVEWLAIPATTHRVKLEQIVRPWGTPSDRMRFLAQALWTMDDHLESQMLYQELKGMAYELAALEGTYDTDD